MTNPARCALFVDHENIWLSLRKAYGPAVVDEDFATDLAQALLENCKEWGELEYWAAVADWTKGDFSSHAQAYNRYTYDVILNLTGPNNADLKIQNAINDLLGRRPEIDTYIIATGDRGYQPIVQRLVFNQKRAVIWGVRGATNQTLQTYASDFRHLDNLIASLLSPGRGTRSGARGAGLRSASGTGPFRTPARPAAGVSAAAEATPVPVRRLVPADGSVGRVRMLPLMEPRDRAGALSNLDALVVYVDYYMKANHFAFFTFAKFLDFLNQRNLVGLSDEEREMWLKSAVASDVFSSEEVRLTDHHTGEAKTIRRFRLAEDNPRVIEARAVIENVLKFLADTLTGPFNPSFSKLRDQLQAAIPDLTLDRVHHWLSWLKETNVLLTKEVPHKRDPSIKVKLVRLNPEHFLVKHLAAGPYSGPEELLVCVVDSHLIEHGHAWMAASKLLERIADKLTADGRPPAEARKEAKEILDAAKSNRIVRVAKPAALSPEGEEGLTESEGGYFPSMDLAMPPAAPPASQVYLERDHARVIEILECRNRMIRLMHESLRGRAWIARSTYQREVAALFAPSVAVGCAEGADVAADAAPSGPEGNDRARDATLSEVELADGASNATLSEVQDPGAALRGESLTGVDESRPAAKSAAVGEDAAADAAGSSDFQAAGQADGEGQSGTDASPPRKAAGVAPHELVHFWINLLTYLRIFLPRQVPNPRGGTTNALMLNPSSRVAAEVLAGYFAAPNDPPGEAARAAAGEISADQAVSG